MTEIFGGFPDYINVTRYIYKWQTLCSLKNTNELHEIAILRVPLSSASSIYHYQKDEFVNYSEQYNQEMDKTSTCHNEITILEI